MTDPSWSPVIHSQGMVEGDLHNSSECHSAEYVLVLAVVAIPRNPIAVTQGTKQNCITELCCGCALAY